MKTVGLLLSVLMAGASGAAVFPSGRFGIGTYWLAPCAQTEAHIRDLHDAGIDVVCLVREAKPETRALLKKYGVGEIVDGYIPHPPGSPEAGTWKRTAPLVLFDKVGAEFLRDYRAGMFPTFCAVDLGDEPCAVDFPHLGKTVARTRQAVGNLPLYLNLFPNYASTTLNNRNPRRPYGQLGVESYEAYIDAYCKYVPLDHISWDHYLYGNDRADAVACFYDNFRIVADACRRTGRVLRFVGQVNSSKKDEWTSVNRLRFQGFATMAFGGESVMWACWTHGWWHNCVLDGAGRKTEQYEKLKVVNGELRTVAKEYMRFRSLATHFVGFGSDCSDLKGIPVKPAAALDTGYVRELAASDGRPLVVGVMASRTVGSEERALLILAADDPYDAAPVRRTVRFRLAEGLRANVVGGRGAIATTVTGDVVSFPLDSSSGALVVVNVKNEGDDK